MDSPLRKGFHRQEINQTKWEIPLHYRDLVAVGSGAYGTVCSAKDVKTGQTVAIKKLQRPFQSLVHAKRAYRELRLLRHMNHENAPVSAAYLNPDTLLASNGFRTNTDTSRIVFETLKTICSLFPDSKIVGLFRAGNIIVKVISLLDVFTPDDSVESFQTFYLVMPYVPLDLARFMKRCKLNHSTTVYLLYQILRGLQYIHSAGIVHRDLKPSNLGVNENYDVKILDFGLARQTEPEMTGYVVTRWYRAPEVILNWMHYNQTVDIWSVGCILAEMITGRVLFPGGDHFDELNKIIEVIGSPGASLINRMESKHAQNYLKMLPQKPRKNFKELFPTMSTHEVDLLERMLDLDPESRITAAECLAHPYLEEYQDSDPEPPAEKYDDSFESVNLPIHEWKSLSHMEIMTFEPRNPCETAL